MVKGYEFEKGRYVTFTPEEIKALDEKGDGNILIKEFVPLDQVDRVYVDKVYYLGTDKGGERHYQLLAEALRKTKRAGLGQYAARGKQYLVLIRPAEGGLVMEQLHYANEVRQIKDVQIGTAEVTDGELKLAVQIIEQAMVDAFKPETYKDTVKEKIKTEIQKKVDGQEISTQPDEAPQTQIIDLMEALKASLAKTGKSAPPAQEAESKPARRKAGGRR
jgi:DNA end-binding protein Ku